MLQRHLGAQTRPCIEGRYGRDALTASAMVIGLRVALMAGHGDSDVERASINLEPEALAIHDHVARRGRDGGAAVTGVGQADAGQVADGVRNRDGHLAHDDMRAGTPAGRAELRRYCRQVPAGALAAALPAQHEPLLFQTDAGTGIAPGVPAEPASDLLAVRRAAICWQQPEQCLLVRIAMVSGLSHVKYLPGNTREPTQQYSPDVIGAMH